MASSNALCPQHTANYNYNRQNSSSRLHHIGYRVTDRQFGCRLLAGFASIHLIAIRYIPKHYIIEHHIATHHPPHLLFIIIP
jgi:hypothetical protein